jgi:hypothetical protein
VQQVDIVRKLDKPALCEYLSAEGEYERLSAERVEVWRH